MAERLLLRIPDGIRRRCRGDKVVAGSYWLTRVPLAIELEFADSGLLKHAQSGYFMKLMNSADGNLLSLSHTVDDTGAPRSYLTRIAP